jgi:putative ABC transport system substrate-binding protein
VTAAKNATETIPIVMIGVRDPAGTGLIASLARPGGNVTGVSGYAGLEIVAKQLELLKETVPKAPPCGHPLEPDQCVPSARDKRNERPGPVATHCVSRLRLQWHVRSWG